MRDLQPELRAIFCEALDRPTLPERADYLDEACHGKPELRQRVEALLQAHAEASCFLQGTSETHLVRSGGLPPLPQRADRTGAVIGPYRLRELIGEGGMGLVFVAEQE